MSKPTIFIIGQGRVGKKTAVAYLRSRGVSANIPTVRLGDKDRAGAIVVKIDRVVEGEHLGLDTSTPYIGEPDYTIRNDGSIDELRATLDMISNSA